MKPMRQESFGVFPFSSKTTYDCTCSQRFFGNSKFSTKTGVGGGSCFGWRWILGLGFPIFFVFFFQNCPPSSVLRRPVFIGKNVARFSNLVPQLLSFIVNLIFLVFLDFSCFFWNFLINIDSK